VKGLRLLDEGLSVGDALQGLLDQDSHREGRQVHGVDACGNRFVYTGPECLDWAGDKVDKTYSLAGNRLVGGDVLEAMEQTYLDNDDLELTSRLIAATREGMEAGGDKLGKRSAAVQVYAPEPRLYHDLRIDEHNTPVDELERVFDEISSLESEFATPEKELGRW